MGASGGGDRDVTFRFLADVGDAVEGVKSVGTEVKTLGTEIKETAKAPDELALAMERAEKAVAKLSDPKLSPIALQRAVLQADLATEGLAEAMKKAAATGGPTPPELTAKVKSFEAAVVSANARAGALRDRLADLRVKGDQTAQGFEKMTQYGGSATSMMQGLADSSTGLVGGFGKAALAVFGFVEALKMGYSTGEKIREAWKSWFGTEMPNLTNWFVKLKTGVDDATGAFDRHGVVARSLIGIHNAHTQALAGLNAQMDKLFPGWTKEAEQLKKIAEGGDVLNKILKEMSADHQDLAKFGKQHAETIISILGPALAKGALSYATMSAEQRVAVRAALDHVNALGKESDSLTLVLGKLNETAQAYRNATLEKITAKDAAIAAYQEETTALYKKEAEQIKALNAMTLSDEEYNKRKKEIHDETTRAVEEATKQEAEAAAARDKILRESRKNEEELQKATEAATAAASDQAKATDAANEALKGTDAAFDEVTKGASSTAVEFGKAGDAINKLKGEAQELIDKMKSLGDQLDATATKARKLSTDIGFDPMGLPPP